MEKYKSPKTPDFTVSEEDMKSNKMKKTLLKVISQYHPDKLHGCEKVERVLCEEITKILTSKYEVYKEAKN